MVKGLESFGEFTGDTNRMVGSKLGEDVESGGKAVRGFEEEGGLDCGEGLLELFFAFAFFDVEKALEREGMRGEAGGDEGGGDGGGTGKDGEVDVLIAAGFEKTVAGIGETGGAGIRDDGDFFSFLSAGDEFGNALIFVMIVEGDERA